MTELTYLSGLTNEHASEAIANVLPVGQNSPQRVGGGYITEQISGTAFTVARADNRRSWLYRRRPSVRHLARLEPATHPTLVSGPDPQAKLLAQPLRWKPRPDAEPGATWLDSLVTMATAGSVADQTGGAFHTYAATASMIDQLLVNSDGELVIFPEIGGLLLVTEFGRLEVQPSEMAVIPRGVAFRVELVEPLMAEGASTAPGDPGSGAARGYVCENYGQPFRLPDAGLVGLNALAMPRDFLYPTAAMEDDRPYQVIAKWQGMIHRGRIEHSPFDVAAWHGSYAPYKYDLRRYCPIGPVLFDHPDPSIWTLMTSPSDTAGVANIDLVLFRDRWLVAEGTFRPPWFHRNTMSEMMGMVSGQYDGKADGFVPGAVSLHNAFIPHGPDTTTFEKASADRLEPVKLDPTLAVMAESRLVWRTTAAAMASPQRDHSYINCWDGLGDS
jgi:homogentisate 1,2-dioxygenase